MKSQSTGGFILLLTFGFFPVQSRIAHVNPSGRTCKSFPPTFADEIEELRAQTPRTFVEIAGVTLSGEVELPSAIRKQIVSALKGKYFDSDSEWVDEAEGTAREILQDQGFFQTSVKIEPHLVEGNSIRQRAVLDMTIDQGLQYRLDSIKIVGSTLFAPNELRKFIPIQDGELFSVLKIRKGIMALDGLYFTKAISILP
jgi:outer membrane protein assembly factor BamA